MSKRIVVDPITRIEGHLRIEVEVKDGVISDAWSSSSMVRGIEKIVCGRDPRDVWAFVQRTCGFYGYGYRHNRQISIRNGHR